VDNFDIEAGQACGCPGGVHFGLLSGLPKVGQRLSPSRVRLPTVTLERWGQNQPEIDASLAKSVASKFRGDTRVERFRRREIGAAAFRVILMTQAGETAAIK
jgi:hypothetical protein